MSVVLQCSCGSRIRVGDEELGRQVRCSACKRVLDVPTAEECATSQGAPRPEPSPGSTIEPGVSDEHSALAETAAEANEGAALAGPQVEQPRPAPPAYRLASPGQIGWATFFGGPMGGFLLMGRNYAKCGRSAACWAAVAGGVLVTVAAVGSGFVLPETNRGVNYCFAIPLWLGTYATARFLQGQTFAAHQRQGGEQASGWTVVGFVLLGIGLTLGAGVGAAAIEEIGFGVQRLQVNSMEEIYYSRDITEAEARSLGRVLQDHQYFDGASEKSVRLRKEGREYVLSLILLSGFEDPQVNQELRDIAGDVSHAFGGEPVRIELCDRWETMRKRIPAERRP